MKTNKDKEKFIELRAKGYSFDKISKQLKISKKTLIDWSREFSYEIRNLKAIEIEALQERYKLLKESRIVTLSMTLTKIEKQIDKADFSGVSPERLMELKLKYLNELKGEEVSLVFEEKGDEDNIPIRIEFVEVEDIQSR